MSTWSRRALSQIVVKDEQVLWFFFKGKRRLWMNEGKDKICRQIWEVTKADTILVCGLWVCMKSTYKRVCMNVWFIYAVGIIRGQFGSTSTHTNMFMHARTQARARTHTHTPMHTRTLPQRQVGHRRWVGDSSTAPCHLQGLRGSQRWCACSGATVQDREHSVPGCSPTGSWLYGTTSISAFTPDIYMILCIYRWFYFLEK